MGLDRLLTRNNFWSIAINSTASFVLAYLFIFYLNHFSIVFTAGMFHFPVSFDFSTILFHVEPYEWTHDAVKLIYSAGPMLMLLVGFISLVAYFSLMEEIAIVKIFFLWLSLHAFNYFFGGLLIGNIFKQGVGHVFNWMYLTDTGKMIIALIGFFGLLMTSILYARPMAISANSYFNELKDDQKPFFITAQLIVPYIIGTLLVTAYFLPELRFQEKYSWISLGILILITAVRISTMDTIYFDEEDRRIRLSRVIILTAIAVYVGLRIAFSQLIFVNWS